jgi:hypothetical protein
MRERTTYSNLTSLSLLTIITALLLGSAISDAWGRSAPGIAPVLRSVSFQASDIATATFSTTDDPEAPSSMLFYTSPDRAPNSFELGIHLTPADKASGSWSGSIAPEPGPFNKQLVPGTYYVIMRTVYADTIWDEATSSWGDAELYSTMLSFTVPKPVVTPEPTPTFTTYLTKGNAKTYMRRTLRKRFGSYKYGTYNRLNRCKRLSRGKVRCDTSWLNGDVFFDGRISARLEKKGARWNTSYRIKRTNEFCLADGKRKNCTKTLKLGW